MFVYEAKLLYTLDRMQFWLMLVFVWTPLMYGKCFTKDIKKANKGASIFLNSVFHDGGSEGCGKGGAPEWAVAMLSWVGRERESQRGKNNSGSRGGVHATSAHTTGSMPATVAGPSCAHGGGAG
jgi:hypothetical protein